MGILVGGDGVGREEGVSEAENGNNGTGRQRTALTKVVIALKRET